MEQNTNEWFSFFLIWVITPKNIKQGKALNMSLKWRMQVSSGPVFTKHFPFQPASFVAISRLKLIQFLWEFSQRESGVYLYQLVSNHKAHCYTNGTYKVSKLKMLLYVLHDMNLVNTNIDEQLLGFYFQVAHTFQKMCYYCSSNPQLSLVNGSWQVR